MQVVIRGVTKRYKKKTVLRGVDLATEGGRCIGILGSNGSGKSTFLSILAGVLPRTEGEFWCDDQDLFADPTARSQYVGYVPQGTPLIEELTARDNLLLWYDKADMEQELQTGVLRMLGIDEFLKVTVSKMSGGMKKRLSIGCAMAKRPPILLLDEPTAALDLACKEQIADYLRKYKAAGGLLFLTTHDTPELALCDEIYILKNGVLVPFDYDGNVEKLVKSL